MNEQMIEKLLTRVPENATVKGISVYPHWVTALSLRYGLCCYIPSMPGIDLPAAPEGFGTMEPEIRLWEGQTVRRAAKDCLSSNDILSRSVGLALLNSALPDPELVFEGESQQFFNEKIKQTRTCCIGHFNQAREWRDSGFDVTIIELKPKPGDIHWNDAAPLLKECDIVFITGLTLVNDTFEKILELTPSAKERVLFGPSVPFCDLWFDYGITTVGSTRIMKPLEASDFFRNGGTSVSHVAEGVLMKINTTRGGLCG